MKRIIIGKYKVDMYDNIEEMPIIRYNEYNKYVLIDSGIGSTLDDINNNIDKVSRFISKNDKENGIKQLMLLKQNLYFVRTGKNPEFMAFACLIHSINGRPVIDFSSDNLERIIEKFKNSLTPKRLKYILGLIKKKVETELHEYFPELMDSAEAKEYYGKLNQRSLFIMNEILDKKDYTKEINEINVYLLDIVKPGVFHGENRKEIKYQKEFEGMCFVLNQNINKESKNMTVLEFYNSYDMLRKQKPKKASHGRK